MSSTTASVVSLPAASDGSRIELSPQPRAGNSAQRSKMHRQKKSATCPLCGSILSPEKYLEIVGVWQERKRLEKSLKGELQKLQDERARLREENKKIRREMKRVAREAALKATAKEKRRADRLSLSIQGKAQKIEFLTRKVKELQDQLKRGTTPQVEGLNFERELVKDLQKSFPHDRVEHHGKSGDILFCVSHKGKQVGSILFECKLTSAFSGAYVVQTKKAVAERKATYGILVTLASKKGTAGFWVDNDVIVVHPFGAVHVAGVLRQSILDICATRMTTQEADLRAAALMEYIKSDDFKNLVGDTIFRTLELYGMLKKELKSHRKMWKRRFDHYRQIYDNSAGIKARTTGILQGGSAKQELRPEPKLLPLPSL